VRFEEYHHRHSKPHQSPTMMLYLKSILQLQPLQKNKNKNLNPENS